MEVLKYIDPATVVALLFGAGLPLLGLWYARPPRPKNDDHQRKVR
jgi:hypothetical protein